MQCDFCSAPDPSWAYPCPDFLLHEPAPGDVFRHGSAGAWAACASCSALIEGGKRSELAERVVQALRERQPRMLATRADRRRVAIALLRTYQPFFARHGPRQPVW